MKHIPYFVLLLMIAYLTGCGNNNVGLKGKVVFADNKEPVPRGLIYFDNGTMQSRGTIRSDGTFTMGSLKELDGLPPGTYKVFFADVHEQTGETKSSDGGSGEPIYTSLINEKYLNIDTSGLSKTVEASTKQIDFELERNPNFKKK
ncbi:MAG: carboxypeptidase-like regulatory domain-containing protein [Planctomycetaceae bacterium]|nr:carboxypeptidase-like regulatory domain-containing protein [Planctomycetaceae bacterium]